MGQRASDTRGITFEDVVVPAEVNFLHQASHGHTLILLLNSGHFFRVISFEVYIQWLYGGVLIAIYFNLQIAWE